MSDVDKNVVEARDAMWIDPLTVASMLASLSEEDKGEVRRISSDFNKGVEGTFDALLGKDKRMLVRVGLIAAYSCFHQGLILQELGFEVNEYGIPAGFVDGTEDEVPENGSGGGETSPETV